MRAADAWSLCSRTVCMEPERPHRQIDGHEEMISPCFFSIERVWTELGGRRKRLRVIYPASIRIISHFILHLVSLTRHAPSTRTAIIAQSQSIHCPSPPRHPAHSPTGDPVQGGELLCPVSVALFGQIGRTARPSLHAPSALHIHGFPLDVSLWRSVHSLCFKGLVAATSGRHKR